MTLSRFLLFTFAVALASVFGTISAQAQAQQSAARIWNEQLLGAIRRNVPNPPAHARNLHHAAVAMYNAWAAYSPSAIGYIYNEKVSSLPVDVEAARHEAVSYAAYRILRARFASGAGAATSLASFDSQLTALGYSPSTAQAAITSLLTPAEVGKRVAQAVLTWSATDGFSNTSFPQPYNEAVNPNWNVPLSVLGDNAYFQPNMPLGYGIPEGTNPNFWQRLHLSTSVTQNGIPIQGGEPQGFVGVQGLATQAFSLTRTDSTKPWIDIGPPSRMGTATAAEYKNNAMDVLRKSAALADDSLIDISPRAIGNNNIDATGTPSAISEGGPDLGTGFPTNPVTGGTYASNMVKKSDYYRVLAEYWADGPNSETPPGHWHKLANEVADNPLTVKKIGGTGPTVNALEWDIKTYFSLSGAVHDAACAAWSLKRYYSGPRPITMIRYLCSKGQSTNLAGPSYHPDGIPLEAGVTEVITEATTALGQRHYEIWDVRTNSYQPGVYFLDQIAVRSWPGEHPSNLPAPSIATNKSTVVWMLGKDWLPFQRKTFNTPAFPGYISGHSTFSRSAAEALTLLTGSHYFPGGFEHHTYAANTMQIDLGPSTNVDLQWATYYDAADQAGQSRRYGGIHPYEDDFPARQVGKTAGISAYNKAQKFWSGSIQSETIIPTVVLQGNGNALITWPTQIAKLYKLQKSTNSTTWTDVGYHKLATTASASITDYGVTPGTFYQVIETTPSAARVWNEQLLAAIRRNVPNPPAHARNLFHTAVAMYNAWAAYDVGAVGYLQNEKISPLPTNVEAARHEAISYAAHRILRSRFATGAGAATSLAEFDAQLTSLGYSTSTALAPLSSSTTPAELGKRIAQAVLSWGATDGFSSIAFPQAYTSAVNPNMDYPIIVLGQNEVFQSNMPLGYGIPQETNPNFWQPLALSTIVTQNGIPFPAGVQTFVGVQSLATLPFSLSRTDATKPWIDLFGGPSVLSTPGAPSASDAEYKLNALDVLRKGAVLNSTTPVDISPRSIGNNPLAADTGTGRQINPITGQAYTSNVVALGDYARVLAEFWADGPNSETPPGHWHVLANHVSDNPLTVKKIGGAGPTVNDLEWDVKTYFSLSAATHDAACAAWSLKRYYSGARPITMIRYMGSKGQSTDPALPSYHEQGLPLENGVVELITSATAAAGQRHNQIWNVATNSYVSGSAHLGKVVIYSWPGEHENNLPAPSIATNQSTVRWMFATDWLPFQRKTFNTPAFPGYVSGHSTFSRSAAEALTLLTGSPHFPGGFAHHTYPANSMQIDLGPSTNVDLQWSTYYDAADEAGQSRRYGGIHPYEDDYDGRYVGSIAGKSAYALAESFWDGSILSAKVIPTLALESGGSVKVTSPARPGLHYQWESSSDLSTWTIMQPLTQANTTSISITDTPPAGQQRFYRARWVSAQ